jgi:hypothetical protein
MAKIGYFLLLKRMYSPVIRAKRVIMTGELMCDYRDKSYEKSIEEIGIKSNCTIHFEHDETLIHAALDS